MNKLSITNEALTNYAAQTAKTAIYPRRGDNPIYPTLGLCGETAELLAKIHEQVDIDLTCAEMGDVCWYISALAFELDIDIDETLSLNYPMPSDISTIESHVSHLGPLDTCILMTKTTGEIAEEIKKTMRDDNGQISPERRARVVARLGGVLNLLDHLANLLGTDLQSVLDANVQKLSSRKARGKLQGSGDKR